MAGIFINYRREDEPHFASRIAEHLRGLGNIFIDIDSLSPGDRFPDVLKRSIAESDICVAIVGKKWLRLLHSRRNPTADTIDFVVQELTAAYGENLTVIPVLAEGAKMPKPNDLPPDLRAFADAHAISIDHVNFKRGCQRLIEAIERARQSALESGKTELRQHIQSENFQPARQLCARLEKIAKGDNDLAELKARIDEGEERRSTRLNELRRGLRAALSREDYNAAELAHELLALSPGDSEATSALDEVQKWRLLRAETKSDQRSRLISKGTRLKDRDDPQGALRAFKEALKLDLEDEDLAQIIADLERDIRKNASSSAGNAAPREAFHRLFGPVNTDVELALLKLNAREAIASSNVERAKELLEQGLSLSPDDTDMRAQLAGVSRARANPPETELHATKVERGLTGEALAELKSAIIDSLMNGDLDEAGRRLENLSSHSPSVAARLGLQMLETYQRQGYVSSPYASLLKSYSALSAGRMIAASLDRANWTDMAEPGIVAPEPRPDRKPEPSRSIAVQQAQSGGSHPAILPASQTGAARPNATAPRADSRPAVPVRRHGAPYSLILGAMSGVVSSWLLYHWHGFAIPWWAWLKITPTLPIFILAGFFAYRVGERALLAVMVLVINVPLALLTAGIAALFHAPTAWIIWTIVATLFALISNDVERDTASKRASTA